MRTAAAVCSITAIVGLAACAQSPREIATPDKGIAWVESAAEYRALAKQAYNAATALLDTAIADATWSALPDQTDADQLPVAIIFDVDETLVSNAVFQRSFEPPFANYKLDDWNNANRAEPVPGAAEFAQRARDAGVTLFFVTNRPCEAKPDAADPCPQQKTTIQDLIESGIPADSEHVMLVRERPEWDREKVTRRNHVAQTHRVIMLMGDDLGDFIACSRRTPLHPCDEGATVSSRRAAVEKYADYWGMKWFVLPNPMHGSWTSVE